MSSIQIYKLGKLNTFVIKKNKDSNFFTTSNNSFIISNFNLFAILKYMLFNKLISVKSLEALINEYYCYKENG